MKHRSYIFEDEAYTFNGRQPAHILALEWITTTCSTYLSPNHLRRFVLWSHCRKVHDGGDTKILEDWKSLSVSSMLGRTNDVS